MYRYLENVHLAASAAASGSVFFVRRQRDPAERERQRRLDVNTGGRLADGSIIEVTGSSIYYSYAVRGVGYTAAQDVASIRELIPCALDRLIGPVTLKYLPANPANSIIICENWSGLRLGAHPEGGNHE